MPNNLSGYADDHFLIEFLKPGNTTVKENLECKVNNVRKWMIANHLKMNDLKTHFLFFTRYNLDNHTIPSLKAGDSDTINNKNIKFLRVILDLHLTFNDHITNKSKIALYNLSLAHKVGVFLTADLLKCVLLYILT